MITDEDIACLVSDLFEEKSNPFYGFILDMVRMYKKMSPASRKEVEKLVPKLINNTENEGMTIFQHKEMFTTLTTFVNYPRSGPDGMAGACEYGR